MFKAMITAASSNSGKTAVTCGLLSLLKRLGHDPCAFKCGPDYIDPMFHRSVLGIDSSNLDVFLAGEDGVRDVFERHSAGHGAAVCEGVMGYYDGRTGTSAEASAWHVASLLEIPAILVLRPKGAALTLAAVIRGMAEFRDPSMIRGVIFNDCSKSFYMMHAYAVEKESGIPVLGYLPHMEEAVFASRHLGLMTAEEIRDLGQRIDRIGQVMEETVDVKRLIAVCGGEKAEAGRKITSADGPLSPERTAAETENDSSAETEENKTEPVRIAVARDAAFNFIYAETLEALRRAGAETVFFSPMNDSALPEGISGLYLPGGYPELHTKTLSENKGMLESVRRSVKNGLPTVAECGGFLYLSEELEDAEGELWPVAGALAGTARNTQALVRFGYGYIEAPEDSMLFREGEKIPVHEFHYWDTTHGGNDLVLRKASSGKTWEFGHASESLYAGFPHLYMAGRQGLLAGRFVRAARLFREQAAGAEEE